MHFEKELSYGQNACILAERCRPELAGRNGTTSVGSSRSGRQFSSDRESDTERESCAGHAKRRPFTDQRSLRARR